MDWPFIRINECSKKITTFCNTATKSLRDRLTTINILVSTTKKISTLKVYLNMNPTSYTRKEVVKKVTLAQQLFPQLSKAITWSASKVIYSNNLDHMLNSISISKICSNTLKMKSQVFLLIISKIRLNLLIFIRVCQLDR